MREVFGAKALIQRCAGHKRRNIADQLTDKDKAWVDAKPVKAFGHPDPAPGLGNAKSLAAQPEKTYPGAGAPLREGLQEMFTVARLGIDGRLAKECCSRIWAPMSHGSCWFHHRDHRIARSEPGRCLTSAWPALACAVAAKCVCAPKVSCAVRGIPAPGPSRQRGHQQCPVGPPARTSGAVPSTRGLDRLWALSHEHVYTNPTHPHCSSRSRRGRRSATTSAR